MNPFRRKTAATVRPATSFAELTDPKTTNVVRICCRLDVEALDGLSDWLTNPGYRGKALTIILASGGGSITPTLGMCDMIRLAVASGMKINILVTSKCMSAATFLLTSVPLENRYATGLSRFMMHSIKVTNTETDVSERLKPVVAPPSRLEVGADRVLIPPPDLGPDHDVNDCYDLQRVVVDLYLAGTNRTREQILKLLDGDNYFDAETAREYDLIRHVL